MDSFVSRNQVLLSSAVVACHATLREPGFRQRDLKFYFELFSYWSLGEGIESGIQVQTTQLTRLLSGLVDEGYAKRLSRSRAAPFRLTRLGLIAMLSRVVEVRENDPPQVFLFAYFFLRSYRSRLIELVQVQGNHFPAALRIELEALLDTDSMLESKIRSVEKEIRKLSEGVNDAEATSALSRRLFERGMSVSEVVSEVEKRYPYEFNSLKPLHELMAELPADTRAWELERGNELRSEMIWKPALSLQQSFLQELLKMRTARMKRDAS